MKKNIYISASTDPIKDTQSVVEYAKLLQGKADFLHCDIMDGEFVKAKTYNYDIVKSINQHSLIMLDVHLMVKNPGEVYQNYIDAGANILTVHYEAVENKEKLVEILKQIKQSDVLAGLSIKPQTTFKQIKTFLFDVDVLLVMSVEPGMSGQKFMPEVLEKIKEIDAFRKNNNLHFKIEVDGGVNEQNSPLLIENGVDILVSGSYIYNSKDKEKAIFILKK